MPLTRKRNLIGGAASQTGGMASHSLLTVFAGDASPAGAGNALLLESGSGILLESGSFLLLE